MPNAHVKSTNSGSCRAMASTRPHSADIPSLLFGGKNSKEKKTSLAAAAAASFSQIFMRVSLLLDEAVRGTTS